MRILLLAPIYALVSWCMMVFLPISSYIEIFRDIYEAYTLYCFWVMLVLWCGGQRRVIEIIDRQEAMGCYLCPLVQPCGCGLPVYRFRNSTSLFRYAQCTPCSTYPKPPWPSVQLTASVALFSCVRLRTFPIAMLSRHVARRQQPFSSVASIGHPPHICLAGLA